jgi:hypothetical protein
MPIPLRGLRTVRTLAGRVDRLHLPHRAHIQIACLEIEKARHASERRSANQRVAELDARLHQIEAQEAKLLQRLSEGKGGATSGGIRPIPRKSLGTLKIKY